MTKNINPSVRPTIEQTNHNATIWIGHSAIDNKETLCGQTFVASTGGDLESIEVFSSMVTNPGNVVLTLHNFDPQQRTWGPVIGSANVEVNNTTFEKWVRFNIPGLHLEKGKTYGFRLACSNSFMGVGEAAGSHAQPPFANGEEWQFTPADQKGNSFSYFSLAFKVGLRA
jgi:hypothetical protein